jgi:YgiT-type zinc finger domain-containing protein
VKAMIKITSCPSCNSDKIQKVRKNWTGQFKGQTYTVPNLEYYECPDCGEKVYDREAMRKIETYSPAYERTHVKKKTA